MAKEFWQKMSKPVFRSGFIAIGALIIILTGISLGFSSALTESCGAECIASNLALTLGGVILFIAFENYVQSGYESLIGVLCMILSVILIAADYTGWAGSRPLLIGSVFVFVGGIFSLITSRK
jgi:hypothetical protein